MNDLIPVQQHIEQAITDVLKLLDSGESKRIYRLDIAYFVQWMSAHNLTYQTVTTSDMIDYREHLAQTYESKATAQRMLSVVRRLFKVLIGRGIRSDDPFVDVKGYKLANESTHIALSKEQASALLNAIDQSTGKGKRDYVLIALLIRTGLRRTECAALTIGDLSMENGHHVATIRHGKGDRRRIVKIPVDVFRSLEGYIRASGRTITSLDDPLFIGFDRRPAYAAGRISDKVIERIVAEYGKQIGFLEPNFLTPHDLRATFITLAREGGATLEQRQYAAGHSDPRTTQRYDRRKLNLDDNAVDYIRL